MEKELDIIIPAYKAHTKIRRTLHSIASQSIKDIIQVTICNDAGEPYTDIIKEFEKDLDIKEYSLKVNSGPGVARQLGLDNTTCPFVMFSDADDEFGDPFCLEMLLNEIKFSDYDMVISRFIQQYVDDDGVQSFLEFNEDKIWMHGKIYRRDAIDRIGVRFRDDIRQNEDGYFNQIFMHKCNNIGISNIISYYWLYYPDSITKTDNYSIKGYEGWYKMMLYVIEDFEKCIKNKEYEEKINSDVLNYIIANCITIGYLEYNTFCRIAPKYLCDLFLSYMDEYYKKVYREWSKEPQSYGFCEASFADGLKTKHREFNRMPSLGFEEFVQLLEDRYQKSQKTT